MKKIYLALIAILILGGKNLAQSIYGGLTSYSCNIPAQFATTFNKRSSVAIDSNGNKWIGLTPPGSSTYQLVRFNGAVWDSFPPVPSHKINALAVDASNNLWIGTDSGLVMYNGSVYTIYNTGNSNITSNMIMCLAVGNGNIYAGTTGGLCVFNGSSFSNYNHANNGLSHDTIYCITYESPTAVWLGNGYGLEKYYGFGFSFYFNLGGIGSQKVNCIYVDQQGNKWLGTDLNGAVKFDNTNFYTMQQLMGPYALIGGLWPKHTYSICKGPNGGVSFLVDFNSFSIAGLVEITGNTARTYKGVGYCNSVQPQFMHSVFVHEPNSNKIYYINTWGGGISTRVFLFSFDDTQYEDGFYISNNNSDYLDINHVAALITANDDMGWDGCGPKYFVPKKLAVSPLHNASVWIGGYHNGALHVGAMTYRQAGMDFWPGPLDTINATIDTVTALQYNKVWKVNRYDIANFIYNWNAGNVQNGTFYPASSILSWPAHGSGNYSRSLAPFVDINGDGLYDPITAGDYPLIKGDQMIWWIFNDVTKHNEAGSNKMGIEVHASAYAFICPNIDDSNRVLNYTTFYNYKIFNRSQDRFDSCYVTNWLDVDFGNYQDDYIGCDVTNNFGYVMNGDSYDENGYKDSLGIFSCNILKGPVDLNDSVDNNNNGVIDEPGEEARMHTFTYYTNTGNPQTGNPSNGFTQQYYNFMNGRWRDGTYMTYGGNGTNPVSASNPACRYLFPGNSDPYGVGMNGTASNPIPPPGNFGTTGWTMQQAGIVKNDLRFMAGCGKFTMQPGKSYDFDCAFVFSQDSVNCFGDTIIGPTCTLPRAAADNIRVKRWFDNNSFPSCLSLAGVGIKENSAPAINVSIYPNPATDQLFIELKETPGKMVVEVLDMVGNVVKGAVFAEQRKYAVIPVADLADGLYLVRIRCGSGMVTKKFIKQ